MDLSELSKGSKDRINRIKEIKECSDVEAIEYSIVAGWFLAENNLAVGKIESEELKKKPILKSV